MEAASSATFVAPCGARDAAWFGSERVEDACSDVRLRESVNRREPRLTVSRTPSCRRTGLAWRRNTPYALRRAEAPHVRPLHAPYGNTAASVTRPAKDEILVMERQVPSVRLE